MIRLPMIGDQPVDQASSLRPQDYWRSLEELSDTPAFRDLMEREFPEQASAWHDGPSRRQFVTLMGASLALGGVGGCNTREPAVKIVPYVRKPEGVTPGVPLHFATAMPFDGGAFGVLVESLQGRPTKIEGNPQHPASLGATSAIVQASILGLYDPDRAKVLTYQGRIRGWDEAAVDLQNLVAKSIRPKQGKGFRILTESVNSPTLRAQLDALLKQFPEAKWHEYEPAHTGSAEAGAAMAFGSPLKHYYQFEKARRILALDADLFGSGPGHVRYARDFAARRRMRTPEEMNRLYVVESYPTGAGLIADHRLALRPSEIEQFVRHLAAAFGLIESPGNNAHRVWLDAVVADLRSAPGQSLVAAGEYLSASAHALAAAINVELKNVGQTVIYRPAESRKAESLADLVADMERGDVETLLILGGNPAYSAPADVPFAKALAKVANSIRLGLYEDETSRLCQWHVPEAHYLESWSDSRAYDGTATIIQPLIAPLYGGRTAHEVVAAFLDPTSPNGQEIVQAHWKQRHQAGGAKTPFEQHWRRCLHDGVVPDTADKPQTATLKADWKSSLKPAASIDGAGVELIFRPDPTVHDGRFANNAWLQELPKPVSKLTWDNAAIVSPKTAADLGFQNTLGWHGGSHGETLADTANLIVGDRRLDGVPVFIVPGHTDNAVTLHLGYGRTLAGRVGTSTGFDANRLRTTQSIAGPVAVRLEPTGRKFTLACTQSHHAIKSEEAIKRGLVRTVTLDEMRAPGFHLPHHEHDGPLPSVIGMPQKPPVIGKLPNDMFPPFPYDGNKWGMVIDLSSCVGCTACVAACQAENNIPVVGKDQVTRGREMHWLRIDQYHAGDPFDSSSIQSVFEPVACVHCENAPCEVVCPVEATTHSPDGLNEMTYNRCVGTRYCSNNCPYKVRRFNFLLYADYATESLKLQRNPEVTVRSRGVMEKCTFCIQRIRHAQIQAKNESRPLRDGEVVTACQSACPTQAIVFGDMNEPAGQLKKLKTDPLQFGLLSELNTRPRLTYQAVVRNPNPKLGAAHHG